MTATRFETSPALEMGGRAGGSLSAVRPGPATAATPAPAVAAGAGAPRVVGLDLSLTATGIAYMQGDKLITTTVRTKASDGDGRLMQIVEAVGLAVGSYGCVIDLAVIEDLPTHAHGAGITGMAHGAVRAALLALKVPYATVPPATLKKYATGRGNATKPDMRMALFQRAGIDLRDDNQVDAWWLQAAGLDHLGAPLVALPKAQREALAKVAWPEVVA